MSVGGRCRFHLGAFLFPFVWLTLGQASVQFQPVSNEELRMTSEPLAPGAPAIVLYREVYKDDCGIACHSASAGVMNADRFEENYLRIKILTEAGRKYGDVEIPLPKEVGNVTNINARTIRPDGSIVNFSGKIFEKTIVKAKGFKYVAQTFSMPDVQVGSIIEYYYTVYFAKGPYIFNSNWVLNQELFTKKAKFFLRPLQSIYYTSFRWTEHLPPGTASPRQRGDGVELEVDNVAAFQVEDFMPPENELKARVDFIYSSDPFEGDANQFWKSVGKNRNGAVEKFLGRRGAMEPAVAQIVSPSDAPEVKLRKIYDRVQQLRNTSYEVRQSEQEQQRENPTPDLNVEDVWKHSSGRGWELSWLYLAMVRAAGFEAYPVVVADRRNYFFNPQSMQSNKLDSNLVLVKLNGKDLYLDPGAAFTPFAMLRWDETGVPGLRLDKDGGSWVQTSLPESSASQIQRKAALKLSPTGDLEGSLVVTFTGLEGLRWRVDERNEDDTARKRVLEEEVQGYIPVGSTVELTKPPDWNSSETPFVAEFRVKVPGWAALSGRRALFPVGIFSGTEKHVFEYSQRVHPIYFEFLSQKVDDVDIELPPGWQVTSVPQPQDQNLRVVEYAVSADNPKGSLHLSRKLDINILTLDTKYYGPLRSFFQMVKAGDEQLVVLLPGTATSSN
jgi:hypothetical protein